MNADHPLRAGIPHFGPNKSRRFQAKVCSVPARDYELVGASQALYIITYDEQVTNTFR